MLTAAIFFSTLRVTPQLVRVVRNWFLLASVVLMFVAVDFWLRHGFGTFAATGDRALDGLQALIVLETTIITVMFPPFRGPALRLVLPLVGLVVVVLSIQRTVWAATLVAAAVLVMTRQKSRGSKSRATPRLLVVAAVVAVVLLIAAGPPGVTNSLTAGYQQTSTEQGSSTFSFRLQGWSILINRQITGPPVDLVIGSPSGTGYERVIDGITFTVAPHSEYVTALDETGILGVALLVWAYVTALRKSRRRLRSPSAFVGNVALLFTALLALQLTYFIGYSEGAIVGLMLGLACGFVHGSPPRGPSVTDLADRPALTS
jgi:O-antigen ligase